MRGAPSRPSTTPATGRAFGNALVEQPAMQNVLADLALESEAATATAMRIARGYDEDDAAFRRVATAVSKYWVCKRAPLHAVEALECLGGNGYVEESGMPRLLRDSPLNSIWEGSGNVAALDVLRALAREPDGLPAFLGEVEQAAGADARLDAHVDGLKQRLAGLGEQDPQFAARRVVEDMGLALQGSLLVRHAPAAGGRRVLRLAAGPRGRPRLGHAARGHRRQGHRRPRLRRLMATLTYAVDGPVARITLDRPERGNGITMAMPRELADAVEQADLDPAVHAIALSGQRQGLLRRLRPGRRGRGPDDGRSASPGSPLDPMVQAANHDPSGTWDPMVDWQMMRRNVRGFMSLFKADKPVLCKVHGFCVAGGTDMALCSDLLVMAADARIGYPPARVWGSPTTSMWLARLGPQRAKRLLLTGDLITGAEAAEWGLAIEAPRAGGPRRPVRGAAPARGRRCP